MKTKRDLLVILAGILTASLIISNILAFKLFTLGAFLLPAAVIMFPIVYIVNDLLAEVYGFKTARKVILLGFVMNLVAVLAYTVAIALPAPGFFEGSDAFATVLSTSLRVLIASFAAYLVGSLLNAYVLVKLKERFKDKLALRVIGSTVVGEYVDAAIFITIAFAFTLPLPALLTMIVAQGTFKVLYETALYPVTRKVITWAKGLKEA